MASSRKSRSSDLAGAVRNALAPHVTRGTRLTVGLSGGVDSAVLLDLLAVIAPEWGATLDCVHVHHGISPNADHWAAFCERLSARYQLPIAIERVQIAPFRHLGLEGAARAARYEAFARRRTDYIVLAHHRDDQAETLLVQLVRGAGLAGLAAMPAAGALRQPASPGSRVAEAAILRPMLDVGRGEIEAYARDHGLAWVDDESNADLARSRNFVRHRVMPVLREAWPDVAAALARSASHAAEAITLVDELARIDEAAAAREGRLAIAAVAMLPEPRARSLLRFHLARRGVPTPDSRKLAEMLRQLVTARPDANVEFRLALWRVRRYGGELWIERAEAPSDPRFDIAWHGETSLALTQLDGTLRFEARDGEGLSRRALERGAHVRVRRGGERLRLSESGPRRQLKHLLQEARIPPWRRPRLPLVFCGDELAWVPGIGVAWELRAAPGELGCVPIWEPASATGG